MTRLLSRGVPAAGLKPCDGADLGSPPRDLYAGVSLIQLYAVIRCPALEYLLIAASRNQAGALDAGAAEGAGAKSPLAAALTGPLELADPGQDDPVVGAGLARELDRGGSAGFGQQPLEFGR